MNDVSFLLGLADVVVKTSATLVAIRGVMLIWPRASATQRHTIWLVGWMMMLALPFTLLIEPRWTSHFDRQLLVAWTGGTERSAGARLGNVQMVKPRQTKEEAARKGFKIPDWKELLTGAWLTGTMGVLSYRLLGSIQLIRLKRRSTIADDPRMLRLCNQMKATLGLGRKIDLRITPECRVPMTWGTWLPVILLPANSLRWSDQDLFAVLSHEGAHLMRHHPLSRWLAQIACAIYWPNPLVWCANRWTQSAQEQSADDHVLHAGAAANRYANQLLEAAISMKNTPQVVYNALAMANPSTLERRLLSIIDNHQSRTFTGWGTRLAALCFAGAIFAGSALAQLRAETKPGPAESVVKPDVASASTKARKIGIAPANLNDAKLNEVSDFLSKQDKKRDPELNMAMVLPPDSKESESSRKIVGVDEPAGIKARKIIVPHITFENATIQSVVDYLESQAKALDPEHQGIKISLSVPASDQGFVTFNLSDVSLLSALDFIASVTGCRVEIQGNAIRLLPSK